MSNFFFLGLKGLFNLFQVQKQLGSRIHINSSMSSGILFHSKLLKLTQIQKIDELGSTQF